MSHRTPQRKKSGQLQATDRKETVASSYSAPNQEHRNPAAFPPLFQPLTGQEPQRIMSTASVLTVCTPTGRLLISLNVKATNTMAFQDKRPAALDCSIPSPNRTQANNHGNLAAAPETAGKGNYRREQNSDRPRNRRGSDTRKAQQAGKGFMETRRNSKYPPRGEDTRKRSITTPSSYFIPGRVSHYLTIECLQIPFQWDSG